MDAAEPEHSDEVDPEDLWRRRNEDSPDEAVAVRVAAGASDPVVRARAQVVVATHRARQGETDSLLRDLAHAEQVLAAAGDDLWRARCLDRQVIVHFHEGRFREATTLGLVGTRLARRAGDAETEAVALTNLGRLLRVSGDHDRALGAMRRGLRLARRLANQSLVVHLLSEIGDLLVDRSDYEEARRYIEEAERLGAGTEVSAETIVVALAHSRMALALGEPDVARTRAGLAVDAASVLGNELWLGAALRQSAVVADAEGSADAGVLFRDAVERLRRVGFAEQLGGALIEFAAHERRRHRPGVALGLLQEAATVAWQQPSVAATAHEAVSRVFEDLGDPVQALHHLRRAVTIGEEHRRERSARRLDALRVHLELEESEREVQRHRARSDELAMAMAELQRVNDLLAASNEERQSLIDQLHHLAEEDALTEVANRRQLERRLAEEVVTARRLDRPISVAMVDVDRFKRINDQHSHVLGDVVLQEVARILQRSVRDIDVVGRWGGEEFVLLLVGAPLSAAWVVCERARESVARHAWSALAEDLEVTISIGVATDDPTGAVTDVLAAADTYLLAAKRAGRNRVEARPAVPKPT